MSTDTEVCLAWLEAALQQLRPEERTKVVGYLEAILEEVVFETKMVPGVYPRGVTYPTGGDHRELHPWLDPLGDAMRLVYYDHRGNGRSGRPPIG